MKPSTRCYRNINGDYCVFFRYNGPFEFMSQYGGGNGFVSSSSFSYEGALTHGIRELCRDWITARIYFYADDQ